MRRGVLEERGEEPVLAAPDPRPGGGLRLLDAGAPAMEEDGASGLIEGS